MSRKPSTLHEATTDKYVHEGAYPKHYVSPEGARVMGEISSQRHRGTQVEKSDIAQDICLPLRDAK